MRKMGAYFSLYNTLKTDYMKRVLLLIVVLMTLSSTMVSAQKGDKHHFDVGVGLNGYGIIGYVGGPERDLSPSVFLEYRFGLTKHIDIGLQANYRFGKGETAPTGVEPTQSIKYNQIGAKAVADYIFLASFPVRPFIGAGIGLGNLYTHISSGSKFDDFFGSVGPRVGVEVWRFRLSLEFDFAFDGQYGFISTETASTLNLSFSF